MFFKQREVRTVLLVSLSNIGDIVLTFPVFDALCEKYPGALFSVVVSRKGKTLFEGHPRIKQVYVLDKTSALGEKLRWLQELRKEKFDIVVDLRNSMLPYFTRSYRRTRPMFAVESAVHMRDRHFQRLQTAIKEIPLAKARHALQWSEHDIRTASGLLKGASKFVVVAPGAADQKKRWTPEGFVDVIRFLRGQGVLVVVAGDRKDGRFAEEILKSVPGFVINLCGLTTLKTLAFVLDKAELAVVNDSGIMHLCSYLNVPTVALFGPTDPKLYGPWGRGGHLVVSATGKMTDISSADVISAISRALT